MLKISWYCWGCGLVVPGIWVEIINKNLWKWVRNRLGSSDALVVSGMLVEI